MSRSPTLIRCTFCNTRGPRSRQDVIPRWVGKLLGGDAPFYEDRSTIAGGVLHPIVQSRPHHSKTLSIMKLRNVCDECNTGWMHDLEERARPVLAPILTRSDAVLHSSEVGVTVQWALKTALTFDAWFRDRAVDAHVGTCRFHILQRPWPGVFVWLARYRYPSEGVVMRQARFRQVSGRFPTSGRVAATDVVVSIQLGNLAIRVAILGDGGYGQPSIVKPAGHWILGHPMEVPYKWPTTPVSNRELAQAAGATPRLLIPTDGPVERFTIRLPRGTKAVRAGSDEPTP